MHDESFSYMEKVEVNWLIDLILAGENPATYPEGSAYSLAAIRATESLPVMEDWSAFAAITRDCDIVWVDRDPPYSTVSIEGSRIRRISVFEASKRYPSLASLCPVRPENAVECCHCGGTGQYVSGCIEKEFRIGDRTINVSDFESRVLCYCGGLGWLCGD